MSGVKREGCSVASNSKDDEMGRCEGTRTKGGRCSKLAKNNGDGKFFCSYHIDQLYDPPKRTGKISALLLFRKLKRYTPERRRCDGKNTRGKRCSNLVEVEVPEAERARALCRHHSGQGKDIKLDDIANELEHISLRMGNMERTVSETSLLIGMDEASLQSIIAVALRANSRGDSRAADLDDAPTDIDTDDESDAEQGGEGGKLMKQDGAGISEPERVSSAVRQPIHDDRKLKRETTSPRRSPRLFGSNSSDVYPPGSFNPFGAERMVL